MHIAQYVAGGHFIKRTLSLILSLLMVFDVFSTLTFSAQTIGDDVVTRVSDLADTGAEADLADTGGDDTIYTSIDGQYYYQKLDDGTVCFNGLKTQDQKNAHGILYQR